MVLFNYSTKELTAKIVYYGPGLCGKTSNLQYIHGNLPGNVKGKMLSLATKTDRTLFFDFLPIDLGEIRGMKTRVQLYTVPGQVFYNETRKLVLKGADGIVFVADSQEQMLSANAESFKNLEENMRGHGLTLADMPHVIQFNKRDLPKLASIEQLNSAINKFNAPFYESVATTGIGIQDTLKAITKLVLLHLTRKYDPRATATSENPAAQAPAASQPAAPPVIQVPAPGPAETQAIPLASIPQPDAAAATIAVSTDAFAEPQAQPQPEQPAIAASVPAIQPTTPAQSVSPEFDDNEIDELVGEVAELEDVPAAVAVETAQPEPVSPFQIDETNVAFEETVEPAPILSTPDPPINETAPIDLPEAVEETAAIDRPAEPVAAYDEPVTSFDDAPVSFEEPAAMIDASAASLDDPTIEPIDLEEQPGEEVSLADDTMVDAQEESIENEVVLTDVAEDQALFSDPNLEVAGVAPGEERSIVIPVELGEEGQKQRFKLSVRLRLDPVD